MTDISPELAAHMARDVTTLCHCWRLTRGDGAVFGFTDHDRPVSCDGTVFRPETGLAASEAKSSLGLAVDSMDVEGALSSTEIREADIAAGLYDGARIETLLVNWAEPEMFARLRVAVIGKVTRRDGGFVAELESLASSLDRPNGRTIRRRCDAELGDARCGFDLDRPGFRGTGTVAKVESAGILRVDGLDAFDAGWFGEGVLTWTSGGKAGRGGYVTEHRKDAQGVSLLLREAVWAPVAVGDTFMVTAGCDKRFSTCKAKFANGVNFRGFPHLPGNDAGYGYVTDGGVFDGGPIVV